MILSAVYKFWYVNATDRSLKSTQRRNINICWLQPGEQVCKSVALWLNLTNKYSTPLQYSFWATVCRPKTVRPMLSDRCLSVLSVCPVCLSVSNVGTLWLSGWMDQDETWHGGRPRPWPHRVRWGPSTQLPFPKGAEPPQFSAHVCCGQTAG